MPKGRSILILAAFIATGTLIFWNAYVISQAPHYDEQVVEEERTVVVTDPVEAVDHRLSQTSETTFLAEIDSALADGDLDLAEQITAIAKDHLGKVPQGIEEKLKAAKSWGACIKRSAGNLFEGVVSGESNSVEGMAAATITDFLVIGDIRDLAQQATAYPDYDPVIVAAAAGGIAMEFGTMATLGAAAPAKAGVSILKAARKTGKVSARLPSDLFEKSKAMINVDAFHAIKDRTRAISFTDFRKADLDDLKVLARSTISREGVDQMMHLGRRLDAIAKESGPRGALATLASAGSIDDITTLKRLSARHKGAYRGALKLAPDPLTPVKKVVKTRKTVKIARAFKASIDLGGLLFAAFFWALSLVGYLLFMPLKLAAGRMLFRRLRRS